MSAMSACSSWWGGNYSGASHPKEPGTLDRDTERDPLAASPSAQPPPTHSQPGRTAPSITWQESRNKCGVAVLNSDQLSPGFDCKRGSLMEMPSGKRGSQPLQSPLASPRRGCFGPRLLPLTSPTHASRGGGGVRIETGERAREGDRRTFAFIALPLAALHPLALLPCGVCGAAHLTLSILPPARLVLHTFFLLCERGAAHLALSILPPARFILFALFL